MPQSLSGWWKFHRTMDEHPVWCLSDGQFKVWISILNKANHADNEWWDGKERVVIPSGSFITSLDHLAAYSNTTKKTVRLALEALEKMGSITAQRRAQRYTHITLVNSERWRGELDEQGTNKGTLRGTVGAQLGHSRGTVGALTGECKNERMKEVNTSCEDDSSRRVSQERLDQSREILSFLNRKTGRNYRATKTNLDFIVNRLKDGITMQQLKAVIAIKVRQWGNDDVMSKFLRPATLCNKTKCEQYVGELPVGGDDDNA